MYDVAEAVTLISPTPVLLYLNLAMSPVDVVLFNNKTPSLLEVPVKNNC